MAKTSLVIPTYHLYGEEGGLQREFWLHCETIAARSSGYRWEIGLHRHESFCQFLYIRAGSGDALLPAGTVVLRPPCVVVVPPGPVHGFRFSRDIDGLVITLVPERMTAALGLTGRIPWFADPIVMPVDEQGPDAAYLDATFRRIAGQSGADQPARDALLEAHVATIVLMLRAMLPPHEDTMRADLPARRVQALRDLVGQNFRDHLTVETYAERLGMSPTHLNRLVRQVTGMRAHDFILERVIDEAKRSLVFTDHSIRHVSETLGFSDPAYFSRCFRQRTGLTPRAFRLEERMKLRNKEEDRPV